MGIGVISSKDEQPITMSSKFGPFAIVTNGFIDNSDKLAKKIHKQGRSFSEIADGKINSTELTAKLILSGRNIVQGIEEMQAQIQGSCSLLILNKNGIYAARDKFGYTPLVIGRKGRDWAVTTETSAFLNLGYKIVKFLEPGEIVLIGKSGLKTKRKGLKNNKICSFLWVYTGFPASKYDGINVEISRERCGANLAKEDDITADMVAGIPDSGTVDLPRFNGHQIVV